MGGLRPFLFSVSQLNRPKVNKIVEILEKAKSCYWPALQNVYMNVTDGEAGSGGCLQRGAGAPPHSSFLWLGGVSWVLREQVPHDHRAAATGPGAVCASDALALQG